ncbi:MULTISPECIES: COX15/CtaA family protein [Olivibacter]|jgi:cytochrome c oxidase assembly protein subunit 15|uniref:Cytochrome oxidase assembly n=2 Tax=Sphingobacteriaceae TaxID=84566 RepID=F4C3E0_SPHS2|nr:COX15/CtaA family protein [Olivibacter sp. UJ_SKK_5.1]MDX3912413.1 COX15/CtaA family protein [Pseudosphingobacterium sp.]
MSVYLPGERRFVVVNKITILALFLLILAGGVVRSTGSGMGCPDWPKCFDQYVPPTNESQLPEGYEQKYIDNRARKNERFAKTLDLFGFAELAEELRNDKSILQHEEFNAAKTWTEYINRLVGAVTGFFLLLCAVFSTAFLKSKKRIFYFSVLNLFVVFLQAWLGSIVVSTNLLAWVITVHMLLALVILAISIYTYFQAKVLRDSSLLINRGNKSAKLLALVVLVLIVVQVILGTTVREEIDFIASSSDNRAEWVSKLSNYFNYHRDIAIGVFVLCLLLFFLVRTRYAHKSVQSGIVNLIVLLVILQLATGFILSYLGVPAYAQTTHLVLASLLFGAQYYLMLLLGKTSEYIGQ